MRMNTYAVLQVSTKADIVDLVKVDWTVHIRSRAASVVFGGVH